jgi:YVTN family beta-propeller protein
MVKKVLFPLSSVLCSFRLPSGYAKRHSFWILKVPMLYALCSLLFLGMLGCQAAITTVRPPLEEEGEIYLYLQPLPQEANRLKFTIEKIFAVSSDGREFPLDVHVHGLKGTDVRQQRLLASGRLPPGSYSGLSFQVKNAILKVEEGEATLRSPEEPVKTDFPFSVKRKKAYLISAGFKYPESIRGGFSFSPVFSMLIPGKPLLSLVGYVTNSGSSNITVFDKQAGLAVAIIGTGRKPMGMALDQRLRRAYVALSGDDAIDVLDVVAQDVTDRIRLNTGDQPQELALTPGNRLLLTVNHGSNTVSFIDATSLIEVKRIKVGNGPNSVLIDSTGRRAYVFNTTASTISVIDIPNKMLLATIGTDPSPLRGQFNKNGDKIYVIHEWSSYVSVIDPLSLSVARRYQVRMGMASIKVDTNTGLVYLGRKNDTVVEAYDPFSFVPVDFINTGGGIHYMTIDGEGNNLNMVNPGLKTLIGANLISKKMAYIIDVGESPYWVTVMGER